MAVPRTGQAVVIGMITVAILYMMIVIITLIIELYCKSNKIKLFFKISSTICVCSCFLSSIGDLIHMIIAYNHHISPADTLNLFPIILFADTIYYIGSLSLYIYVLGKLYLTFRSTTYSVSKYYILFILILLLILSLSMAGYLYAICSYDALEFYKKSQKYLLLLISCDLLIDVSIFSLFIYKLQTILSNMFILETEENDIGNIQFSPTVLNKSQYKMITLITRQTILGTIIILSNSLFFIVACIDHYVVTDSSDPGIAFEKTYALRSMENSIIISMIYLNFAFSTSIYFKLCKYIHNGCHYCCVQCIQQKVNNQRKQIDFAYRVL